MGVGAIIDAIEDPRKGRRWVSQFISSSMSGDALAYAVKNNIDPWAAIVKEYNLGDPTVAYLARLLIRAYWDGRGGISDSLTSVSKIYNRLARNPANREMLKKPETIRWLNRAAIWTYNQLYNFVWES